MADVICVMAVVSCQLSDTSRQSSDTSRQSSDTSRQTPVVNHLFTLSPVHLFTLSPVHLFTCSISPRRHEDTTITDSLWPSHQLSAIGYQLSAIGVTRSPAHDTAFQQHDTGIEEQANKAGYQHSGPQILRARVIVLRCIHNHWADAIWRATWQLTDDCANHAGCCCNFERSKEMWE